jgi:hypothetical protein
MPSALSTQPVADDPTLRPGDIVATNAGLMAYNGGTNGSTFTPISTYAGVGPLDLSFSHCYLHGARLKRTKLA